MMRHHRGDGSSIIFFFRYFHVFPRGMRRWLSFSIVGGWSVCTYSLVCIGSHVGVFLLGEK